MKSTKDTKGYFTKTLNKILMAPKFVSGLDEQQENFSVLLQQEYFSCKIVFD